MERQRAIDILVGIAICKYRPGLQCGSCPRFIGWDGIFPDCEELTKHKVQEAILTLKPELAAKAKEPEETE